MAPNRSKRWKVSKTRRPSAPATFERSTSDAGVRDKPATHRGESSGSARSVSHEMQPGPVDEPTPPEPARRNDHRSWLAASIALLLAALSSTLLWPWQGTGVSSERRAPSPETSLSTEARSVLRLLAGSSNPPAAVTAVAYVDGEALSSVEGSLPLDLPVPRGGHVLVVVDAPGRARFVQQVAPEEGRSLRIPLPPGARLSGVAVDERGSPVVRATVRVERADGSIALPWATVTDEEGRFSFDTLFEGAYHLDLWAPGHASISRPDVETGAEPLRVTMERVATVAGRVVNPDGSPADRARVVIAGSGLWPARQVETDERGHFRFSAIPPGVYEVRTFSDRAVADPRRGLVVEPGGRSFLTFSLREGVVLHGLVLDHAAHPIAGAEITVAGDTLDAAPRTTTTDRRGRFRVSGLTEHAHRVSVFAEGFVPVAARTWAPGERLEFRLEPAATIAGIIVDENLQPVEGARIEIFGEDERQQPVTLTADRGFRAAVFASQQSAGSLGPSTLAPMALEVTTGPIPPIPLPNGAEAALTVPETPLETRLARAHVSDAHGRFRVEGVPPGHIQVVARRDGLASASTRRIYVGSGAVRDNIEIMLAPAGRLVGRVVDDRDQGIEGVLLEIRSDQEPYPRVTFSDDRGDFELDSVVGELIVTALPQNQPAARARAEVAPRGEAHLEIRLEGDLVRLRGRTVDSRGFPIESVQLTVSSLRADAPYRRTLWSSGDGTFEVSGLPAPPLRIEGDDPRWAPARVDVFETEHEIQVVLSEGVRVSGSVFDGDHEPVEAEVELHRDDLPPEIFTARTSGDGTFSFDRVRPGDWSLRIRSPDHLVHLSAVSVERGRPRTLDPIHLEPAGSIEGTVVDALGTPIARATVGSADGLPSTRTDADGRFRLGGLEDGELDVWATHPAAGEGVQEGIRVYRGRETPGIVIHLSDRFDPERADSLPSRRRGVALIPARRGDVLVVGRVIAGSGAERAGLRSGDVLLEIDGEVPSTARDATRLLAGAPSVPALLRIRRGTREARLVVDRDTWLPD